MCRSCFCRDTEEELCTTADERDKLAPQVEEARWKGRQLEKELAEAQVGPCGGATGGQGGGCPRWQRCTLQGLAPCRLRARHAACLLLDSLYTLQAMPSLPQEDRERLAATVGQLEASVEELRSTGGDRQRVGCGGRWWCSRLAAPFQVPRTS